MKAILPLLAIFLYLCGCAQRPAAPASVAAIPSPTPAIDPLTVAKQSIAKREQWAYDGDYKVADYTMHGQKAGWKVRVFRINNPNVPKDDPSRYDPTGPVVILINEKGWVTSYKSPYRRQ